MLLVLHAVTQEFPPVTLVTAQKRKQHGTEGYPATPERNIPHIASASPGATPTLQAARLFYINA